LQGNLPGHTRGKIGASNDICDSLSSIVYHHGQVIRCNIISAPNDDIAVTLRIKENLAEAAIADREPI
jgi:hypothetical protein